ncbi:MAG: hypothetical protein J0M18_18510 [Ignavibacteria bacterium]|nr:hypothetical protein [Ignavibacteria bacterium]
MTIQELDSKLKAAGKSCSGNDCIYKIELPGGSMWTRNFRAYTLYNRVRGTILNDISRDTVIQGLEELGLNEDDNRQYVRTQPPGSEPQQRRQQQNGQQQGNQEFNAGLIVIGGVVAAVVLIILITS